MGEESMMSEVSQSEVSTTSSGGAPESEGGSKAPIIAVAVILLLLGAILVYFVTSSGGGSDTVKGEGEASSGGDKDGSDAGYTGGNTAYQPGPPKTMQPPPTTKAPVKRPPKTTQPPPTTKAPVKRPPKTTQPPPTTKAPVKHIKLTCTIGRSGVLRTQLPPNKMCNYVFYMHIYYDVREKQLKSLYRSTFPGAFTTSTTTYGLSFALSLMPAFPPQDKDAIKKAIKSQFRNGYFNFGALDVDVRDYPAAKSGGLQYLKLIGEAFKGRPAKHHLALGIFNARDGSSLINAAKSATTDFPEITMLIINVHSERSSNQAQLLTMGPNPDNADVKKGGMITLADVAGHLSSLESFTMKGHYLMLSLGLFARGYWTKNGKVDIAIKSVPLDYPSVCKCEAGECELRKGGDFDKVDATVQAWGKTTLVFFDDANQIKKKAQSRLDILRQNYIGIAAYNVEMDDFDGSCGGEKFPRLKAIRDRINAALPPQ